MTQHRDVNWQDRGNLVVVWLASAVHIATVLACGGDSDPSQPSEPLRDALVLDTAMTTWADHGLPLGPACRRQRRSQAVATLPAVELQGCDMGSAVGDVGGCYAAGTIWVASEADESLYADILLHEALHWLSECNWGDLDAEHDGSVEAGGVCIWGEADFSCVLADARTRL